MEKKNSSYGMLRIARSSVGENCYGGHVRADRRGCNRNAYKYDPEGMETEKLPEAVQEDGMQMHM